MTVSGSSLGALLGLKRDVARRAFVQWKKFQLEASGAARDRGPCVMLLAIPVVSYRRKPFA